tara:strand:+ start:213 stop:470 length:258 start_codon:yes stop_codon:yes gene_type:complete
MVYVLRGGGHQGGLLRARPGVPAADQLHAFGKHKKGVSKRKARKNFVLYLIKNFFIFHKIKIFFLSRNKKKLKNFSFFTKKIDSP